MPEPETKSGGTEYREYRMTSRTRTDDEPPLTTDEKWIEYGTRGNPPIGYHSHLRDTASSSGSRTTGSEKTIGFTSNENNTKMYGIDPGLKSTSAGRTTQSTSQIEYLTPANSTTVISEFSFILTVFILR